MRSCLPWPTGLAGASSAGTHGHESGASLLETVLTLAMFGALFGLTNAILSQESQRQQSVILGRELGFMTDVMQDYVALNYGRLQTKLFTDSIDGALVLTLADLAAEGFLPGHLATARNSADQAYHLLVRGVNRTDARTPQVTLGPADLDQDMDSQIDPAFLDQDVTNGELDLEAILVTSGGVPIAPTIGSPAVLAAERFATGYLDGTTARGPYGVWELDVEPYAALDPAPEAGHFVAIVAASGLHLGSRGAGPMPSGGGDGDSTSLDRCPDARGGALARCLADNEIRTSIVFNGGDENGDGTPDVFGRLANVYTIDMGRPVDADDDGHADTFSVITGLAELACADGDGTGLGDNRLAITCPEVRFAGQASFGGAVTMSGDLDVTGAVDAWRFRAGALGNRDLTKGLLFADIVTMNAATRIDKPVCRDQGSRPQIYAAPVAYLVPSGEPILGLRAVAVDHTTHWSVTMTASIDRDTDRDGLADVITLDSDSDHVLVLTRCS